MSGYLDGIKSLREERGLTQMDIAKACGVTLCAAQKWDKDLRNIRLKNLVSIAKCLDISCDELCGLTDPKGRKANEKH